LHPQIVYEIRALLPGQTRDSTKRQQFIVHEARIERIVLPRRAFEIGFVSGSANPLYGVEDREWDIKDRERNHRWRRNFHEAWEGLSQERKFWRRLARSDSRLLALLRPADRNQRQMIGAAPDIDTKPARDGRARANKNHSTSVRNFEIFNYISVA
jgi:hypothetical protein